MSRRLTPYLLAGLLGVVSGVYIFNHSSRRTLLWQKSIVQQEQPDPQSDRNPTPRLRKANRNCLQLLPGCYLALVTRLVRTESCLSCGLWRGCKGVLSE
ncbi:hypothetical protein EV363DRAFT_360801 [Boletus edulis]|nr:hypothetical protein EV363DRAFT_360801 [Boletus edulis]